MMHKYIFMGIVILLFVSLVGCISEPVTNYAEHNYATYDKEEQVIRVAQSEDSPLADEEDTTDIEKKLVNNQWISPGKVQIGNFYLGAVAEWYVTIHNGIRLDDKNEPYIEQYKLRVTTDINEVQAEIPLKYRLYGDHENVELESDNEKDNLIIISAKDDGSAVTINGFSPDDTRVITFKHLHYMNYTVRYRTPDNALEGFKKAPEDIVKDWVIISDPTPVFAPWETRDIPITLNMPYSISEDEAAYYEITRKGIDRLSMILKEQRPILTLKYLEEDEEYQNTDDTDIKIYREEQAESKASRELISYIKDNIPEANLLLYINERGSVSKKLLKENSYPSLLVEFINNGYAIEGNLLTDKWEFWIGVTETTKEEMITTEMCSRWLVNMKQT